MRYELSDYEWTAIKPMLPNKPRGVRRVNNRRVLSTVFLGPAFRCAMARPARELWALHDLLQSLRALATGRHLGPRPKLNQTPALSFCLSMISGQTLRVCPKGKPVSTFPDHSSNPPAPEFQPTKSPAHPGLFWFNLNSFCAVCVPLRQFHHLVAARGQPAHFHFLACRDRFGAGDLRIVVVFGR
jgi:hypothetical protein